MTGSRLPLVFKFIGTPEHGTKPDFTDQELADVIGPLLDPALLPPAEATQELADALAPLLDLPEPPEQSATITLTAANIIGNEIVDVIAAPGSGQQIEPRFVFLQFVPGENPFWGGPHITLKFRRGSDGQRFRLCWADVEAGDIHEVDDFLENAYTVGRTTGGLLMPSDSSGTSQSANAGKALRVTVEGGLNKGLPTATSIAAAGTGYVNGDTLQASGSSSCFAHVTSTGGGGAVTGYAFDSFDTAGHGSGDVLSWDNIAPQSGVGTGFQINVDTIQQGDGTLVVTVDYKVRTLA